MIGESFKRNENMVNKYNRTIRKEDLDIGMEYTITGMKCVTNKFGKKPCYYYSFYRWNGWSICP